MFAFVTIFVLVSLVIIFIKERIGDDYIDSNLRKAYKKNSVFEYNGEKYIWLGNGSNATGGSGGWRMSKSLYFRCIDCGYMMDGDPQKSDSCSCGKLHKDSDYCRLGSNLGDDAIEVYIRK